MISRDGKYWSTGISVHVSHGSWSGVVEFFDDGFADDKPDEGRVSTEGQLATRYWVRDGKAVDSLTAVIDTLIRDAATLGIEWSGPARGQQGPCLYYKGDGEQADYPPPDGWRELLAQQARRIGWGTYETVGS